VLELSTSRVLVTGAAGFVGANLIQALRTAGSEVVGLVRPGAPRPRLADLDGDVELLEVDVLEPRTVEDAVKRTRPDLAVNLVVEGSHPTTPIERLRQLEVAVLGTARLVEVLARAGCSGLVHLGSSLEYGPRPRPHREDDALSPIVSRGVAKAAETIACLGAARAVGIAAVVLRPFSIYGPWDHEVRLVPTAIRAALEGTELPLTEPGFAHDFVHVGDVVQAILLAASGALTLDGKIFNIGTGVQTTNEDLVAMVGRLAGTEVRTVSGALPTRAHDTRVWVADNERARTELAWTPALRLEEGLRSTIAWYRSRERMEAIGR
jgi:nucleoside-diphosphate-sugar epimerase